MLYYLLYHTLQKYFSPLNVFRYITVRTVYASLTGMFLALVFGPWLIRRLRELQIGQYIREEGPQEHKKKARQTRINSANRDVPENVQWAEIFLQRMVEEVIQHLVAGLRCRVRCAMLRQR